MHHHRQPLLYGRALQAKGMVGASDPLPLCKLHLHFGLQPCHLDAALSLSHLSTCPSALSMCLCRHTPRLLQLHMQGLSPIDQGLGTAKREAAQGQVGW